jgi:hypothetical protein
MRGRLLSQVAVAAVCALAACSEPEQKTATGPEFVPSTPPPPNACDFSLVRSLITSYFSSPLQLQARTLEQQMEDAVDFDTVAVNRGFSIMSLIGQASRQGTPSATAGSNLTKALMRCMFDLTVEPNKTTNFPNFPAAYDFTAALTKANGGAYYVRGGAQDVPDTVVATAGTSPDNNISAVGVAGSGTWTGILQGNILSVGRALIYGSVFSLATSTTPLAYDWKLMPPNTTFASPFAVVSVCDGNTVDNAVVNESSAGFLPFVSGNSLCERTQSLAMIESGWGPSALMRRAAHWSAQLLTPEALMAAALTKTGSGGTTSGFKSTFKTNTLTVAPTVKFKSNEPPAKVKLNTAFPITVTVTAPDDKNVATAVQNACVYVTGANNNGFPTHLTGSTDDRCVDPPATDALSAVTGTGGVASLTAMVDKNGGMVLTATVKVIGRPSIPVGTATAKTNVGP